MLLTGFIIQFALAMEPIHQTLSVPWDVWDVTAQDLNEDGLLDLVAFYGERDRQEDKKGFYVYLARSNGSYSNTPSFEFPLAVETGNAFFTSRDGREHLIVSSEGGATEYMYQDNAFVESDRYTFTSLLPLNTRKPVFFRNMAEDLDHDGSDEWIIPVLGGFDIWAGDEKRAHLEAYIQSESFWYSGLHVNHHIPSVYLFDKLGQHNKAVGIVGERGAVFYYGEDWTLSHGHDLSGKLKDQWEAQTALEDINHDGLPDLMVTNTKGTANIEVYTQIYLANANLKYPDKASFGLASKGALAIPFLVDLNGDDKLDLVVRSFPITLRNITSYLFRKKISMKLETRLFKGGSYAQKPSYSNYITTDISEGREEAAHAYGDYDGDGVKDVAVGTRSTSLSVFTHSKSGVLNTRAWKTIKVHTFGIARSADLDASGTDDIVIYHPRGIHQKDIEIIRF